MSNINKIKDEIERLKGVCMIQIKANSGQTFPFVMEMTGYDKLLAFIDSLPEEKPSEDMEEAAKEYMKKARKHLFDDSPIGRADDAFIAGAKWQAKQLLKGSPLPEDTVLFQKGVDEGKRLIMEDAVDGEIGYWNQSGLSIRLDQSLAKLGYDMDTKVKIIIVKE